MVLLHWEELHKFDALVFKVISDFMTSRDVKTIPTGRYDLADGCYVNVDSYETRQNARFEAHKRFVDVQLMVEGQEQILCAPLPHGTVTQPYSEEKDCGFFDCDKGPYCTLSLEEGMAAVFEPWDLHAPCVRQEKRRNRKLVFKIPVELLQSKKTVACCGDSITYGLLATTPEKSYPAVLQSLLPHCLVENCGRNGATAIADYPLLPNCYAPYLKSPEYARAMVSGADVVVLMLGMNDGNPTHHFNAVNGGPITEEYCRRYEETLTALVENFRNLPTKPQVYIAMTTAMRRVVGPQFDEAYIENFTENTRKIRQLQKAVGEKLGVRLIDTLTDMDDPAYYKDGCHLSDAGYRQLAHMIHKAITK